MDFPTLVKGIQDKNRDPEDLINYFKPLLIHEALKMTRTEVDDLVQEGLWAIWKIVKAKTVDPNRPSSMKAYLVRSALNRMRSVLRSRKKWLETCSDLEYVPDHRRTLVRDEEMHVDGVLVLYLQYVRFNGDMRGAHAWVAARLGVSTSAACTAFHKASCEYKSKTTENGNGNGRKIDDILSMSLHAQ
jgi:hypothetical protein